jgi:hypothetical protein
MTGRLTPLLSPKSAAIAAEAWATPAPATPAGALTVTKGS